MSPRGCACVEMRGILFDRLHVIINPPGEFASKLDVVLAHLLKIVQEVGLEKDPITTFKHYAFFQMYQPG